MYPTIYHLFFDWFGLDWSFLKFLNSFGFFVALAFIAASWTLSRELLRKENEGLLQPTKIKVITGEGPKAFDLIVQGLVGFVIGWKFLYIALNYQTAIADPQSALLSLNGNIIGGVILGALLAFLKYREVKKQQLPEPKEEEVLVHAADHAGNITLVAALFGILGAKLFHLLENPDELVKFFTNPSADNFFSGLTMYGGLIVGGAAVIWLFKKKGVKPLTGMDATAPGLMLAYAIGRIGCHVSGDGDWGVANTNPKPDWLTWLPDWMWSYNYPNNVISVLGERRGGITGRRILETDEWTAFDGYGTYLDPGVYPTAFYEVVMCTILFVVLWKVRKKLLVPGTLFCLYLILNGFERFWIEKIRVNEPFIGNITQAEVISVILIILGVGGWLYLRRKSAANGI